MYPTPFIPCRRRHGRSPRARPAQTQGPLTLPERDCRCHVHAHRLAHGGPEVPEPGQQRVHYLQLLRAQPRREDDARHEVHHFHDALDDRGSPPGRFDRARRKGRAAEAPAGSGPGRHGRPPGPAGGPAAPAGPAAGPGAVPGRGPGGGSGPGRRGGRGDAGPRVRGAEPAAGRAEGQLPGDAPGGRGGVRREPHRGAAAGVPPRAERPRAGLGRGAAGPVPRGPGDPAARGGDGVWGGGPTPRRAAGRRPGLRRHRPAGERPGRAAGGGGPLGARVLLRMRALRGGVLEGLPRVHAEEGERRPGPAGRRRRARHHVRRRHGGVRPGVLRREADDRGRGGRASSGRRAPS